MFLYHACSGHFRLTFIVKAVAMMFVLLHPFAVKRSARSVGYGQSNIKFYVQSAARSFNQLKSSHSYKYLPPLPTRQTHRTRIADAHSHMSHTHQH